MRSLVELDLGKGIQNIVKKSLDDPRRAWKNGIWDQLDRFPSISAPEMTFVEGHASEMMERFMPELMRTKLIDLTNSFSDGLYRVRTLVGEYDLGTSHPHDFVISINLDDIGLYFVDPEHTVGSRNALRPAISNLISLIIPKNIDQPVSFASLRFRTDNVDHAVLKLKPQLEATQTLIEDRGMPAFLSAFSNDILFRLLVSAEQSLVQARYTTSYQLRQFLYGNSGSPALEGKVDSHQAVFNHFIEELEAGNFQKI